MELTIWAGFGATVGAVVNAVVDVEVAIAVVVVAGVTAVVVVAAVRGRASIVDGTASTPTWATAAFRAPSEDASPVDPARHHAAINVALSARRIVS